jgi:hypothetical protein
MKMALIFLSALMVGVCSGPLYASEHLRQLEAATNHLKPAPALKTFRAEMPAYRKLLEEQLSPSGTQGLEIDFVLAAHSQLDPAYDEAVEKSRQQGQLILEELKPLLIGLEGAFSENLTESSLLSDLNSIGEAYDMEKAKSLTPHDSFFLSLAQVSSAPKVGLEDKPLIIFSTMMGVIDAQLPGTEAGPIFKITNHLRSEVAVAKLLRYMRSREIVRAALVFGGWHEADFKQIAKTSGLRSNFYCAKSEKPLAQIKLQNLRC